MRQQLKEIFMLNYVEIFIRFLLICSILTTLHIYSTLIFSKWWVLSALIERIYILYLNAAGLSIILIDALY